MTLHECQHAPCAPVPHFGLYPTAECQSNSILHTNGKRMACAEAPVMKSQYFSIFPGKKPPSTKDAFYPGAGSPCLNCQHLPRRGALRLTCPLPEDAASPRASLPGGCRTRLPPSSPIPGDCRTPPTPPEGCCGAAPPLLPAFVQLAPPRPCPSPRGGGSAARGRWDRAGRDLLRAPAPPLPPPARRGAVLAALRGRSCVEPALCRQPRQDGWKGRTAPAASLSPLRAASPFPAPPAGREKRRKKRGRGRAGFRKGLFLPRLRRCFRQPRDRKAVGLLEKKPKKNPTKSRSLSWPEKHMEKAVREPEHQAAAAPAAAPAAAVPLGSPPGPGIAARCGPCPVVEEAEIRLRPSGVKPSVCDPETCIPSRGRAPACCFVQLRVSLFSAF